MNVVATIVLCLLCFAAGCLTGNVSSEKSYLNMLKDQKKIDDEIMKRLADYIKNHIKKDTEEKTNENRTGQGREDANKSA